MNDRHTQTAADRQPHLAEILARTALCETDHPAKAASALLAAAATILGRQFEPVEVCQIINEVTQDALLLYQPMGQA